MLPGHHLPPGTRAERHRRLLCSLFISSNTFNLLCIVNVLRHVPYAQAVVNNLEDAHEQIDTAIATALRESKPVYISVSCNLAGLSHPTFSREPVPLFISPR